MLLYEWFLLIGCFLGVLWGMSRRQSALEMRLKLELERNMDRVGGSISNTFEEIREQMTGAVDDIEEAVHPEDIIAHIKAQMMAQGFQLIMGLIQKKFGGPDYFLGEIENPNVDLPPIE